jgi:hypothetical protein
LADVCSGYLANPMVQPLASLLPLASAAAWLRGDDPLVAWAAEADARGWRVFAEACDGAVPAALVQHAIEWLDDPEAAPAHIAPLREWLEGAATCEAPGIDDATAPWLDQVHTEAQLGLDALRLVELAHQGRVERGIEHAFGVGLIWAAVRRAPQSVLGPRFGLQPVLGQRPDGTWSFDPGSILEDRNAIDALLRASFALFSRTSTQ